MRSQWNQYLGDTVHHSDEEEDMIKVCPLLTYIEAGRGFVCKKQRIMPLDLKKALTVTKHMLPCFLAAA